MSNKNFVISITNLQFSCQNKLELLRTLRLRFLTILYKFHIIIYIARIDLLQKQP